MLVVAVLCSLGCNGKRRELPRDVDDAGVGILQHGSPQVAGTKDDLLKLFDELDWSIGISRPNVLLDYTPKPGHLEFCTEGGKFLDELSSRIGSTCHTSRSPETVELTIRCDIRLPEGKCTYQYRASIWAERNRSNPSRYRVLGNAWLHQTMCADATVPVEADPQFLFRVQIGKSFRALVEQCRQTGTPP